MTVPDPKLLLDAHDAALNTVAILEKSESPPDRVTIDNAVRWASLATAKLIAYQLQQRDNQKPV